MSSKRVLGGLRPAAGDEIGSSLEMIRRAGIEGEDTLIVALNFDCNSRCTFCIIETEIDARLPKTDASVFEQVFVENRRTGAFRRLTISGAEATLREDLGDLAEGALARGGFEVVRIQTNARLLADRGLSERLVAAGVTEYFVSIHAHEEPLSTTITRAPRGMAEMERGVAHLLDLGARVIANTVVCRDNVDVLPEIARYVLGLGIGEAQIWNFLEIGRVGQEAHLVPVAQSAPQVVRALDVLIAGGAEATVKWFPRCLLAHHAARLDNHQPQMLIRDAFQNRLAHNFGFSCAHAATCRWAGSGCDGLHERYVDVFGDEGDLLRPEPLS